MVVGEQSIHHELKYPETTCRAMFHLHAKACFQQFKQNGNCEHIPPPLCISYANVHNYYGPYAYCSLDKGVA